MAVGGGTEELDRESRCGDEFEGSFDEEGGEDRRGIGKGSRVYTGARSCPPPIVDSLRVAGGGGTGISGDRFSEIL